MNVSLAVNVFLLAVKIYAFVTSKSKAILASAADSLVDIASQLVIAYAEYKVRISIAIACLCFHKMHSCYMLMFCTLDMSSGTKKVGLISKSVHPRNQPLQHETETIIIKAQL